MDNFKVNVKNKIRCTRNRLSGPIQVLKSLFVEFCDNSNIHGVRYFTERTLHWSERIWWLIAISISMWMCVSLSHNIWDDWNKRPVKLSFTERQEPVTIIPFPQVTICYENEIFQHGFVFTTKQGFDFNEALKSLVNLSDIQKKELSAMVHICPQLQKKQFEFKDDFASESIYEQIKNLPQLSNYAHCTGLFDSICDSITVLTDEGLCFTYNALNSSTFYTDEMASGMKIVNIESKIFDPNWHFETPFNYTWDEKRYPIHKRMHGYTNGEMFRMFVWIEQMMHKCTGFGRGFKVTLNIPGESVKISQNHIRVPPSEDTHIIIKPKLTYTADELRSYDPSQRQCYFNSERQLFFAHFECPPKFENIASPFPNTKLIVKNNRYGNKYRMTYKVHNCGGILTETMTAISIPNLATNYGELDCAWQYTTNTDRKIVMIVNTPEMNCDTEYLSIYNGKTSTSPRLQRFCGNAAVNGSITINGQNTFIVYHTDNYNPLSKIDVKIIPSDGICGGILESPNYAFSSPKNGTKYPANIECEWIIRGRSGYHIGLTFPNRFMIETSEDCKKDYIKVYDKVSGVFEEIYKGCGRNAPTFLNSTGNEMKVLFHTDDNGDGDGFSVVLTESCGGIFKATNFPQFITSPLFPNQYPSNIFCNYSIVADQGQSVQLRFTHFDLENSYSGCHYDYITIYNSPVDVVGTYCTNRSVTTFSNRNRLDVVFRTDNSEQRTGFKFEYRADQCGGNITTPQIIQSLRDLNGDTYLPSASCLWSITAPSDKRIVIRFEELDLEHIYGCNADHVDVFEGHTTDSKMSKAKLCGNFTGHAPTIDVHSNKATVRFISDSSIQEKGFSALILFVTNCNEHINLTTTQRRYTLNKLSASYDALLDCEYFVTAPKGYVIQARFSQMHLAKCDSVAANNTCGCDYLNIHDGYGPFAEPFGTFCGHTNPPDILTSSDNLYMRFVTDSEIESTGFMVDLEMVESPCGVTKYHLNSTTPSVTIHPPMNGNVYMANMNCHWQFTTSDDNLIEIRFEQFDVEDDPNRCANDFVEIADEESKEIREGLGENTVLSGTTRSKEQFFFSGKRWPIARHRYCGNNTPIDYVSNTNTIHVQFKSNEVVERSGFKFTANILPDCARNYTKLQGRIFSRYLLNCESYISVPENNTISLYFNSVNFFEERQCTLNNSVLKVYDGRNNELLEFHCDYTASKTLFTNTNLLRLEFRNVLRGYFYKRIYDITYLATDKGRGCGGELYNYGGTFSSPGYPNTDRNNSDCTWTINVPMNLFVAIHFEQFDMGSRSTCELNYVEFIENDDTIPSTKFCGTDDPAPYTAKSNQLKVHFKSSMNFAGTGWIANFMAVHENTELGTF